MKRTPFKRRSTGLARSTTPMRRTPMKRGRPGVQPPERRDDRFKAFVRTLPCCAPLLMRHPDLPAEISRCGNRPCDPHHRHGDGKGIKTHDRTCVPLCRFHHDDAEGKRGVFSGFTKQQTRDWHDAESVRVQALYDQQRAREVVDAADDAAAVF